MRTQLDISMLPYLAISYQIIDFELQPRISHARELEES